MLGFTAFAQQNIDLKLANQYYNVKAYDKAAIYYQKVVNKTQASIHYERLLDCYIQLEEYKAGEKLIKRQQKRTPSQLSLYADLGNLYDLANQTSKSKQAYGKGLKLLTPKNQQIIDLANGYLKHKQLDYAISTYQKGRKLLQGTYPFNFELAQVYHIQGNTEAMINEYLDL